MKKQLCSLALWLSFIEILAGAPADTIQVLFIGNSYTYYQNLPHIVSLISDSTEIKIETSKSTAGGASLADHWEGNRGLVSRQIIEAGDFDVVVLQDHSLGPIDQPDRFLKYARLFCDLIKSSGAKPYLYLTWAREKVPQYQEVLTSMYTKVAQETGAKIVPAGPGWQLARELRPQVLLYTEDGSHPNDLGTYLTACIFVGRLTGDFPVSLPLRYYTEDRHGESIELLRMEQFDIQFCVKVAREIVEAHK